jgi:ribosomal protein S18 acetylase RimI-like enzyme
LLNAMIAHLTERGVSRVYLEVEEQNLGAINLYTSANFRQIGIIPDYYGPAKPAIHMMREIESSVRAAVVSIAT